MKATVSALKTNRVSIIGGSGKADAWQTRQCEAFLFAGNKREGSPRASVLAQIYVLAALSIALQARKNITREHYNAWHPGGMIGQVMGE